MKQYGLIGFPLSHSFSKRYFKEKFAKENVANAHYELFPLKQISNFKTLLAAHPKLAGLNVTIPYKLAIFDYLDEIDEAAAAIGAVNTITFRSGKLKGYNTDAYGFQSSLVRFLNMSTKDLRSMKALVFGTGGAAKAVVYTLKQLQINYQLVSRSADKGDLTYAQIDEHTLHDHRLLINTTPLGTSPNYDTAPDVPYHHIGTQHFCYDLVYNPEQTLFLKRASAQGARTINGLEMLHLQAEKAWAIWQETQ